MNANLFEQHLPHTADAVSLVVFATRLLDDGFGIHTRKLNRDCRVGPFTNPDFSHAGRPTPAAPEHFLSLPPGNGGLDRSVIQCRQSLRVKRPQRFDLGHQRGQEQCLDEPIVVAKRDSLGIAVGELLDIFAADAMLFFECRQQFLMIQPFGIVEMDRHVLAESLVSMSNRVEQVSYRYDIADLERVALVDQKLHHHLKRGPFTLQHAGNGDQCLHEGRAEGIDAAKHLPVPFVGKQDVHHRFADFGRLLERGVQLVSGRLTLAFEHPLLGDQRQIPIFQCDVVETAFPVFQGIAKVHLFGAWDRITNEFPQVSLPGNEADDRHRPIGRLRLNQLGELLPFLMYELQVRGVAGQPQNQFVEEQDQRIESQRSSVPADYRKSLVERDERFSPGTGLRVVGSEESAHQNSDELRAFFRSWRGQSRQFESGRVPGRFEFAPATGAPRTF